MVKVERVMEPVTKVNTLDEDPPWDNGQLRTLRSFRKFGEQYAKLILQLHNDESRAEASAILVDEAATLLNQAIIEGRICWVTRPFELSAIERGIVKRVGTKINQEIIADIIQKRVRPLLEDYALSIKIHRPY